MCRHREDGHPQPYSCNFYLSLKYFQNTVKILNKNKDRMKESQAPGKLTTDPGGAEAWKDLQDLGKRAGI